MSCLGFDPTSTCPCGTIETFYGQRRLDMFWEMLQNIQCCQCGHGKDLSMATHLHANCQARASSTCCSEGEGGWHQSLSCDTFHFNAFHHNLPTLDPVVAGPLVRRCCQIFRLPRTTSIRHILHRLPSQECVESEMTQLEESSFIWGERRGDGLTLNMLLWENRVRESHNECLFVDCLFRWNDSSVHVDGGESEVTHMRESLNRVLDSLTPLQNICMSSHERPHSNIRRQNLGAKISRKKCQRRNSGSTFSGALEEYLFWILHS